MLGTKIIEKIGGKNAATFTITGAAGAAWVISRTDAFEPPQTVSVAELHDRFKVDGTISEVDQRPIEIREREAWERIGNAPDAEELRAAIQDPDALPSETAVALGLDELRSARRDGRGNRFKASPEDKLIVAGSPEDSADRLVINAARRVAQDIVADPEEREQLQRGDLKVHALVLAAARELLSEATR